MSERDNMDMLAAEFVLGTLPAEQRDQLQARRAQEPELDALILQWEERLAGMLDDIDPVQPGPELYANIMRALGDERRPRNSNSDTSSVVMLRRQVNRWRWSTALTSAAAAILVAVVMLQPQPAPSPASFVAVFQHDDQQPAFLLTVDLQQNQVAIRPVTAEPKPDKSYQLWIKADELGPNPRSVSVLGDQFQLDGGALSNYDPGLLRTATFGISVEPPGGSPTGQPTGPAIHGFLYPTGNSAGGQ